MNWLQNNKIKILPIVTLVALFAFVPHTASADLSLGEDLDNILYQFVVMVFGRILWAGGLMLNFSIENFVVGFGWYYSTKGIGGAIDSLWGTVRDILNLGFIFGLVSIGFKMILNGSDSSAKKMLGSLLIAALLINFSLFMTKTVVDFSNIAAKQFAGQFEVEDRTDKGPGEPNDYKVSDGFMKLLGISGVFSEKGLPPGSGIAYIFGTMWLFATAAFVFFAGGILLLIRFIVLNIYLLFSPIMFAGFIFPGLGNKFKEYWDGFLKRAFFAPAYLLMIYFSYNILAKLQNGLNVAGNGDRASNFAAISSTNEAQAMQSFEGTIMYFILVCGFLVASLVVANKMGAHGASTAMNLGKSAAKKMTRAHGSLTVGATAAIGRNTVGRLASHINNDERFNKRVAGMGSAGVRIKKAMAGAADSSYDARKLLGKKVQDYTGSGRKGGFDTQIKEAEKRDTEFLKSLDKTEVKNKDGSYVSGEMEQRVNNALNEHRNNPESDLAKSIAATNEVKTKSDLAKTKLNSVKKAKEEHQEKTTNEINELNKKIAEAQSTSDILTENSLKRELKVLQEKIAAEAKVHDDQITELEKEVTTKGTAYITSQATTDQLEAKARASAEAKIKYEKQLAYINARQKEANLYQGKISSKFHELNETTAIAGNIFSALAMAAAGDRNQQAVASMKKYYGEDGTKADSNEQKKKEEDDLNKRIKKMMKENEEK